METALNEISLLSQEDDTLRAQVEYGDDKNNQQIIVEFKDMSKIFDKLKTSSKKTNK